jgi:hypothetical protein
MGAGERDRPLARRRRAFQPVALALRAEGLARAALRRRRREDELVTLDLYRRQLHRTAAAIEEHSRELAILFFQLQPIDSVAVGTDAGQVPASEERLLIGARGGDSRSDERGGEGERGKGAHGGHHSAGRTTA